MPNGNPVNEGVLAYLARHGDAKPLLERPNETRVDPYYGAGSHPDVVERVWNQLGATLPEDCRCLVLGSPALMRGDSRAILAVALGTTYALRVPPDHWQEALSKGAKQVHRYWGPGAVLDLPRQFGPDWIFGLWHECEPAWCEGAYRAEGARP